MFGLSIHQTVIDHRRPQRGKLVQATMPLPPFPSKLLPGQTVYPRKVVKYWTAH